MEHKEHKKSQKECEDMGPRQLGTKDIDGLIVPLGKASSLLTDHLITGSPVRSEPAQKIWFLSNYPYI